MESPFYKQEINHENTKVRKHENQLCKNQLTTLFISNVGFAKLSNRPTFKLVALR